MLVESPSLNERKSPENILPFLLADKKTGVCVCVWLTCTCKTDPSAKDGWSTASLAARALSRLLLGFVLCPRLPAYYFVTPHCFKVKNIFLKSPTEANFVLTQENYTHLCSFNCPYICGVGSFFTRSPRNKSVLTLLSSVLFLQLYRAGQIVLHWSVQIIPC